MEDVYDFAVDTQAMLICPAVTSVDSVVPTLATSADFVGLQTTVNWLAVFLDGTYFPGFFVLAFGVFLSSFFANWIIRLVRLLWQLIPWL